MSAANNLISTIATFWHADASRNRANRVRSAARSIARKEIALFAVCLAFALASNDRPALAQSRFNCAKISGDEAICNLASNAFLFDGADGVAALQTLSGISFLNVLPGTYSGPYLGVGLTNLRSFDFTSAAAIFADATVQRPGVSLSSAGGPRTAGGDISVSVSSVTTIANSAPGILVTTAGGGGTDSDVPGGSGGKVAIIASNVSTSGSSSVGIDVSTQGGHGYNGGNHTFKSGGHGGPGGSGGAVGINFQRVDCYNCPAGHFGNAFGWNTGSVGRRRGRQWGQEHVFPWRSRWRWRQRWKYRHFGDCPVSSFHGE